MAVYLVSTSLQIFKTKASFTFIRCMRKALLKERKIQYLR
jgi:hypothetical protein